MDESQEGGETEVRVETKEEYQVEKRVVGWLKEG